MVFARTSVCNTVRFLFFASVLENTMSLHTIIIMLDFGFCCCRVLGKVQPLSQAACSTSLALLALVCVFHKVRGGFLSPCRAA